MKLIATLAAAFGLCYSITGSAKDFNSTELSYDSFGIGTNIRISLTTTAATAITSYSQLLQSWTGAGCTGGIGSNYISGSSGTFPVSTGSSTIYLSTAGGQVCNTGSLTRSFSIANPNTVHTNAGVCTASTGCVTVTCSNTSSEMPLLKYAHGGC